MVDDEDDEDDDDDDDCDVGSCMIYINDVRNLQDMGQCWSITVRDSYSLSKTERTVRPADRQQFKLSFITASNSDVDGGLLAVGL